MRTQTLGRKALLAIVIAPLLALLGLFLLSAAMTTDDAAIYAHLKDDFDYLSRDRADNGRSVDSLTECTGMSLGLPDEPSADENPFLQAVRAPTVRGCPSLEAFLDEAPRFERALIDSGILLHKYWLAVDQDEQERRFAERANDPLKRWKLSPIDLAAREKYDDYTSARDAFFKASHTAWAPWYVVDANDQRRARLNMIAHVLATLPAAKASEPALALPALRRRKLGQDRIGAEAIPVPDSY